MHRTLATATVALVLCATSTARAQQSHPYLFVWAGDSAHASSEFLAVIDADSASATYGRVLTSVPTGERGMPHHTEMAVAADGHLLANDFDGGHTWLYDVTDAIHPRIMTSFADVAGFSHPHTFVRVAHGLVLSTFQYRATPGDAMHDAMADDMKGSGNHLTGGLVEMDERGHAVRSGSAADTTIGDTRVYPYSVIAIPAIDRAISTTTDMDLADTAATSQWIQMWRLSDLKLLRTFALPPGPHGDENRYTGEPRLLADGRSVYVHTFNCGLYLLRDLTASQPTSALVYRFEGTACGVPIRAGHYWLQTVPDAHALVSLDISDPRHPREVSRVAVGADEHPHWIAMDPGGRRIVMNSGGRGSRIFIVDFDPATGRLMLDQRFRDPGSDTPGVTMRDKRWSGTLVANARPHGSVFSR